MRTAILILIASSVLLACSNKPKYEDGKYIIWTGRGSLLTAEAQTEPEGWTIPTDLPINERVAIVKRERFETDRLLRAPTDKVKKANATAPGPNFLTGDEVQDLAAKASKAQLDGEDEVAVRVWSYLAADRPTNRIFAYNTAKAHARLGNAEASIAAAREAWKRGFRSLNMFKLEKDFAQVRKSAAWASMMIEFEVRAARKTQD